MRLALSPWRFLARLLLFFGVTFALWQPVAPAYTELLLNASRLGIWLTEQTGGPEWESSTTLMSRGTAIFFTNRNFARLRPPLDPQGIPAEWVMANLLLLLPLMLATPAPNWRVRVWRLLLAMVIALILQVTDIIVGIKFFYADVFRGVWSPGARQIYQFLDAFFQSWDTQLFPFAVWAGIHFRDLMTLRSSAEPAPRQASPQRPRAERRRRKRGGGGKGKA